MVIAASWIALRTVPQLARELSIAASSSLSWLVVASRSPSSRRASSCPTHGTSRASSFRLAGMIFAASMNAVSIGAERLFAELDRGVAFEDARRIAMQAGLIPITNSLLAVGLVSLPGFMTGQILSGVSPLIAVRYQVMVMCMVFGASGLSAAMFLTLVRRYPFVGAPVEA